MVFKKLQVSLAQLSGLSGITGVEEASVPKRFPLEADRLTICKKLHITKGIFLPIEYNKNLFFRQSTYETQGRG